MFDLRRHLRVYGPVHLLWIIVILVLCCAALIAYQPDAEKITGFFGFAATLTSLFLGAIAIFYAMIANQGFNTTLGSLQRSSENVETAARNISSTSGTLSTQSERLFNQLADLGPTVLGISEKIDKLSPASAAASESREGLGGKPWKKRRNSGSVISLYAIARSYVEKKPLAPGLVFPSDQAWEQYLLGFLEAAYLLPSSEIRIERSAEPPGSLRPYTVVSLGSIPPKDLISAPDTVNLTAVKNKKPIVDAYFEAPVPPNGEQSQKHA